MSRTISNVLVLFLLVNQTTGIFGKLTILRGPVYDNKLRLICASEDDGSALVWNTNLFYPYLYKARYTDSDVSAFPSTCSSYNRWTDCKMDGSKNCLNRWDGQHWKLTNSMRTPMGPVFDQRWEELEEHIYDADKTYEIIWNNTNKTVLPFSIRAKRDVQILLCDKEDQNSFCYLIIIPGWETLKPAIRKCPKGAPPLKSYPLPYSYCTTEQNSLIRTISSPYEWRTFILTWNPQTRNISLYDPDRLIMTYVDTENYDHVNFIHKMYVRCPLEVLMRYHNYNYFYTAMPDAVLTSSTFNINTKTICLQMIIGLCAECDIDIVLRKVINNEVLQNVTLQGSSVVADHGLPMWQFVKIMTNLTHAYDALKIEMIPKLTSKSVNPVWAIANIRQCPEKGCLRQSVVNINKNWTSFEYNGFWPRVACQKLFYEEQSVTRFLLEASKSDELADKNCNFGYVGPACQVDCQLALATQPDCREVIICDDNGCTCPPGYTGPMCNVPCKSYSYGHACKKKCGSCLLGKSCDKTTGECHDGCNNTEDYIYALPLCQIGAGKPNEAQIIYIGQTTIIVSVPIKWEDEYAATEFTYSFKIKTPNNIFGDQQEWRSIFPNTTGLLGIFTNLQPATTYYIVPILSLAKTEIYGTWKAVNTSTLLAVPSKVLTVRAMPLSCSTVSLIWTSPEQSNKITEGYVVYLQLTEYLGCQDYRRVTSKSPTIIEKTNNTKIIITGLHAYANYDVQVIANNSWHSSKEGRTKFVTNMTDIPAAAFSQLRIQDWKLSWSPPEDCTTILGPLRVARVEIHGVSDNVYNFRTVIFINDGSLNLHDDLYGTERYTARVYALRERGHQVNNSAYAELEFVTPSKEPPMVNDLVVVEIDTRQTPRRIYLRWQSPRLPLNGILRNYAIFFGDTQHDAISVHLNESCTLWDNYICKSFNSTNDDIQVVAYNLGVHNPSPPVRITKEMIRNTIPDAPWNLTFTVHDNSIINLEWLHPWRTGNHLCCFRILVKEISSTLRKSTTQSSKNETHECSVTNYMPKYNQLLYLFPSTTYNISIQTVTIANQSSDTISLELQTSPNINLDGELMISNKSESAIVLFIPKVRNDTRDSVIHIVVIGRNTCKRYKTLPKSLLTYVGNERVERIWIAAKDSTDKLAGKQFTIGNGKATNCLLKDGESYKIMIIITIPDISGNRVVLIKKTSIYFGKLPSEYTAVWIILTIIIFSSGSAACYFHKP